MKKLFTQLVTAAALALAGLFIVPEAAQAQPLPSFETQTVPVPATLAAATTTNFATPLYIDAHKQQTMAFQMGATWSTAGESTGNTNCIYTLAPTVDGTHMDTNKTVALNCYNNYAAGTTGYSITNLSANGVKGWFIIKAVNNSASGVMTNGASTGFVYGLKIGAP